MVQIQDENLLEEVIIKVIESNTKQKNWSIIFNNDQNIEQDIIIICASLGSENLNECIELSNFFAPEHLELLIDKPSSILHKIENAGAIFIGQWTPEAVGDYLAGPNHTLPTSGTAKFSGALGVETFMKNTSLIEFTKRAFKETSNAVIELANSEGLHSHSESIKVRSQP